MGVSAARVSDDRVIGLKKWETLFWEGPKERKQKRTLSLLEVDRGEVVQRRGRWSTCIKHCVVRHISTKKKKN